MIHALMPLPRYVPGQSICQIYDALAPHDIQLTPTYGVFWAEAMERRIHELQQWSQAEWVLCIDSDSMFTAKHIEQLLAGLNDHVDCLCAFQMSRGKQAPLLTHNERSRNGNPTEVDTAHFGLTFIRVAALKAVSLPWFIGVPSTDGHWSPGRIDPDMHFWLKWRSAGMKIYVDTTCRIGHLDELVRWYDEKYDPAYLDVNEWRIAVGKEQADGMEV